MRNEDSKRTQRTGIKITVSNILSNFDPPRKQDSRIRKKRRIKSTKKGNRNALLIL